MHNVQAMQANMQMLFMLYTPNLKFYMLATTLTPVLRCFHSPSDFFCIESEFNSIDGTHLINGLQKGCLIMVEGFEGSRASIYSCLR